MVGMGMVPANHLEALLASCFFRRQDVFRRYRKAVARRIVTTIDERKELQDFPGRCFGTTSSITASDRAQIAPKQRSTAFVRVSLSAMRANLFREMSTDPECRRIRHNYSSFQKRSFKYFDAESAKTVTITARPVFGFPATTLKQPSNAAAALGLTSKASSRGNRLTTS